ncbi:hypothetical protein [Haliovirga abyssi]|uniref:Chromosomal replication initiator protein DnaA n=1 Tax=Haliovirga abyssi TaxID=2996794 RepID=A0AAU9DDA0_9FUSO|nr:hypothetical protein [Haliovirga abyssi]BDU51501.1 chromosomal replication initiator protein DnaA [Haliovirga abyssi]
MGDKETKKEVFELNDFGEFKNDLFGGVLTKETKPNKLKTEKIQIENTGNFLEVKDGIVNIPLELIVFPFFTTRKSDREVNFEYQFKDMGLTMYSNLIGAKIEGKNILQPGSFEKKVFDFILTKFEDDFANGEYKDFIQFDIRYFIVDFLGNKMNDRYYSKIEEALRNMKYTTYSFGVKNRKKAGNFSFESKSFNLLNYEKVRNGKKIFYKVYLDRNITNKISEKRYVKFKMEELSLLEKKDAVALRLYQYISMKRFSANEGEYRIELLAAVVPLKTFITQKKINKKGEEKIYRVSKIKQVLKRISKSFDILVKFGYLEKYKVIEIKEEKSYKIFFTFGNSGFHVSDYIQKSSKTLIKDRNKLYVAIEKAKKNIFFSKKYNKRVENKMVKVADIYGEKVAIEVLSNIYKGLKSDIRTSLLRYIDKVLKELVEDKNFLNENKGMKTVSNKKVFSNESIDVIRESNGEYNKKRKKEKKIDKKDEVSEEIYYIFYNKLPEDEKLKIDKAAEKLWLEEEGMNEKVLELFRKNKIVYTDMIKKYTVAAIKVVYSFN